MMGMFERLRKVVGGIRLRAEQRLRMEEIDGHVDDLIEAGYYEEADDLMADRQKIFQEYTSSLRRSFDIPDETQTQGRREKKT